MSKSYNCPKCLSENTQSFPMIYQIGTTTGTTSGIGYADDVGFINTTSKTHLQSVLAQRTVPPQNPEITETDVFIAFFLFFLIGGVAIALSLIIGLIASFLIALLGYLLLGFSIYQRYNNMARELSGYRRSLAIWQNSWMCLKCGHSWKNNPLKKI